MDMDIGRRRFLLTTATISTVGVAGCLDDDDDTDDDEPENGEDEIEGIDIDTDLLDEHWSSWIPSTLFTPDATVFSLDVSRAHDEFPREEFEDWHVPDLADVLGVEETEITEFVGVIGGGVEVDIVLGTFDAETVIDALRLVPEELTIYEGFGIDEDEQLGDFAIGDGAVILADDARQVIDAASGTEPSLEEDEEWADLIEYIDGGTLSGLEFGEQFMDTPEIQPERTGITVDSAGNGRALLGAYLEYDSEETATELFGTYEQAIVDDISDVDDTLEEFYQEGRFLVLTFETPTFDF